MSGTINFFSQGTEFIPDDQESLMQWVEQIVKRYKMRIEQIDYIFCSDEYLLRMNQDYLQHDYLTDIITFPYSHEGSKDLWADLFISVDRIKDNAQQLKVPFVDELHRVMIHGVLHMIGFSDKDEKSATDMRRAEDLALSLRMF